MPAVQPQSSAQNPAAKPVPQQIQLMKRQFDLRLLAAIKQRQQDHPNPLTRFGCKAFSQSDEDGITLEILRRLGLVNGTFAEFGVGDGLENNTLALLAAGWRGLWVGGQALAYDPASSPVLDFQQTWITAENVATLLQSGLRNLRAPAADLISVDLDGNDLHICRALLESGAAPALFIVEYNGKFPPPLRFCIRYDADHQWQRDDYHSASLQSLADLFAEHGYRCICCNAATGANAFFVPEAQLHLFPEVPTDLRDIYSTPHYMLHHRYGHKTALRTLEVLLQTRFPQP